MKKLYFILLIFLSSLALSKPVRVELHCRYDLLAKAEEIRKAQVGIHEKTGNNDGYAIWLYQQSVGIPKGSPYCAAGQYYCFKEAAHVLNLPESEIPIKKTGLANGIFADAKKRGMQTEYRPQIYDLIVWIKKFGINGHIESVTKVLPGGWVETIGFNTSNGSAGSQRDGGGVYYKKRNIYHPLSAMLVNGLVGFRYK